MTDPAHKESTQRTVRVPGNVVVLMHAVDMVLRALDANDYIGTDAETALKQLHAANEHYLDAYKAMLDKDEPKELPGHIELRCMECGAQHLLPDDSLEALGVFNVFCPNGDCEDRYAAKQ